MIARKLAANHRLLCAAPSYLAERGAPRKLDDLAAHDCLVIKERDHPFGVWRMRRGEREHTVKVRGPLSANNGEMVVQWAVDGRGIAILVHGHLLHARRVGDGVGDPVPLQEEKLPQC